MRVLCVSTDPSLLATREILLTQAGCEVVSVMGTTAALEAVEKQDFDVVVVGHSMPHDEKRKVVYAINRCGAVRTIALSRADEPPLKEADLTIEPDPRLLIEAIRSLMGGGAKDAGT